jgi:hypothetical protein
MINKLFDLFIGIRHRIAAWRESKAIKSGVVLFLLLFLVTNVVLGIWWSQEPEPVSLAPRAMESQNGAPLVTGVVTTTALILVAETLLDKPGGYISNDMTPPSVFLDNMPNWEYGALTQIRDLAIVLRNDMSRSQSQSTEDPSLAIAAPQLNFSNDKWIFPATENQYRVGIEELKKYRKRLSDEGNPQAQFYARADNLSNWLALVEKRLGDLSAQLSASVGQKRIDTSLAGDPSATQSTPSAAVQEIKTSWWKIDDVFYESRGACWALIHFLKAIEHDFRDVLIKKNALVSLRQIIRDLEATQETLWSPMVLNGSGFGTFANHSLVMASYVSRANSAVINLRELLADG